MKATSKYNRKEIFKNAWIAFKVFRGAMTFAYCLQMQWKVAKKTTLNPIKTIISHSHNAMSGLLESTDLDKTLNQELLNRVNQFSGRFKSTTA